MNIFLMIVLLSLLEDAAVLPTGRGSLRAARNRAIAHNRTVYNNRVGRGKWYDEPYHNYDHYRISHPEWEGKYVTYNGSEIHTNAQQGRWATDRLSGHRRFAKWCKDYYPSGKDKFSRLRWEDELKEYYKE